MKKQNDKFGIKMKQWCREHEALARAAVEEERVTRDLFDLHEKKLAWLQHERLVHLIVTVMVVIGELFIVAFVLFLNSIIAVIVMLLVAVLLGFYFYHYFFLENTVQRWYRLAEEMLKQLKREEGSPHEG